MTLGNSIVASSFSVYMDNVREMLDENLFTVLPVNVVE